MRSYRKVLAGAAGLFLGLAAVLTTATANAVNTSPADLYFVATDNGTVCDTATNQEFQSPLGTSLNKFSPGLIGADGYQVTVHNNCAKTVYVAYGQSQPWTALAANSSATYTFVNNPANISINSLSTSGGSNSTLAYIELRTPPDVTASGSNSSTTLSTTSISKANSSMFMIKNDGSNTLIIVNGSGGVRQGGITCTGTNCQISPGMALNFTVIGQGNISIGSATLSIGSGGGGGGGSSSSAAPVPATIDVVLAPADGTVCRSSNVSASAGSWIGLPAANECTPPVATPNAKLLGWSTTPNFPVAIAQRQVDNGWGAYEIFDANGQLAAVFIPAGGATQLTAPGSLYPIWKS